MSGFSSVAVLPMVAFPMKYQSLVIDRGLLTVWGTKRALFASGAQKIMGNWVELIYPHFRLIFGYVAMNQEYPRMALFSPRSVRKKQSRLLVISVWTSRSI